MPKIAYLVSQYPAVSHTFIQREIFALRQKGFEIATFSINVPTNLTALDEQESAQTFYVKKQGYWAACKALISRCIKNPWRFFNGMWFALTLGPPDLRLSVQHCFYLGEAALLVEELERLQIAHLHVHFANAASTVAMIAHQMSDINYSLSVHGPDEFYDVTSNCLKEKIATAQFIVAISYYTQSQLMRLSAENQWPKIHVIHLGIDADKFQSTKRPKNSTPQLLSVGRLSASKGHLILCAAILQLKQAGEHVQLTIVGEGPERRTLQDFIQQNGLTEVITLAGALPPEKVTQALQQSDIFVLASFAEGLPVALMEAQAMEIPCIASCINGIPELIRSDETGLLVYPSDVDGLVVAIRKLLHQPELGKKLASRGREMVIQHFELMSNAQRLATLFDEEIHA